MTIRQPRRLLQSGHQLWAALAIAAAVLVGRHLGILQGPAWVWFVLLELPVVMWIVAATTIPVVRAVRSRPAELPRLWVLERELHERLPRAVASSALMDCKALRASAGHRFSRYRSQLSSSQETCWVRYDQQLFTMFIAIGIVDLVVGVLIHVALPAGPVRLVLDLLGIVGFLWVVGFLASLKFYRHELSPASTTVHFAHLATFHCLAPVVSAATCSTSVESTMAQVVETETNVSESAEAEPSNKQCHATLQVPVSNNLNVLLQLATPVRVLSHARSINGQVVDSIHIWADDPQFVVDFINKRSISQEG